MMALNVSSTRGIWQLAGGPATRSYADIFLKYGVGLVGPGDAGPWKPERDDSEFDGGFVRRFASEVRVGDVFLLRTGISRISAVGIVASDYMYLNQFDDVNGWDLQHARRVRWQPLPEPRDFEKPVFGANPPRLSRVRNKEVLDYARRFLNSPPTHCQTAALPDLPPEEPPLEDVPRQLRDLVAAVCDILALFSDPRTFGEHPGEDEMIAHFVIPFLRALGWPPERIAVKWRHIDVAVFRALPRTPKNLHLVMEAKRLGAGVEGALEQAKGYMAEIGALCDVVVTDGIRYRMYSYEREFEPIAYANLARLKQSATRLFAHMMRP